MAEKINLFNNSQERPQKRVLFVITQSELGGAQRFLINFAKNLNKEKYELAVALGEDGGSEIIPFLKKDEVPVIKLKHARRIISPFQDLLAVLELRNIIKKFQPDILFLNSSKTSVWGPLAVYFPPAFRPAPKIIYRIGGWSFNDPQPAFIKWLWIILEKIFARYKDIIIVNNLHDFEQAKRLKIKPKDKIELVYNGIDLKSLDFFEKNEAKIKLFEKLPSKPGRFLKADFIVGTIANFYKTKGLEYLIDSARILNARYDTQNTVFIIIGGGSLKESLELKVKNLKLENTVFFAEKIPDAYQYLKAFDVFVLPSVKEGFPWTVFEAMAAKLPVIATRVGAVPEIIEDKKNGMLVKPAQPEQIAEKIQNLLNNDHLRQEMGIQAHQTILFKFPLDKMVKKIESIL